ncbi:unnamed protein product [Mycena citricolor]|uniref:Uncharacterized protein n=1 Tax=Mycena citricolor TaxID=2018698 RepID=A0AAD2HCA1_9AGAR|nr:unnamed protein product [Mycena citricolor]
MCALWVEGRTRSKMSFRMMNWRCLGVISKEHIPFLLRDHPTITCPIFRSQAHPSLQGGGLEITRNGRFCITSYLVL